MLNNTNMIKIMNVMMKTVNVMIKIPNKEMKTYRQL